MKKYAIFTMDVEAFYDALCFKNTNVDKTQAMEDGLKNYLSLLDKYNIKADLFVLTSFLDKIEDVLKEAVLNGHHINLHGTSHDAPLSMDIEDFKKELIKGKQILEDKFNIKVNGVRTPCFSIDDNVFNVINELGFKFDSSYIDNKDKYYQGYLSINTFEKLNDNIYKKDNLYEFEIPSSNHYPVGGGAYLRLAPNVFSSLVLNHYLNKHNVYIFYVHPFELSNVPLPNISFLKGYDRFYIKRKKGDKFLNRIEKIIKSLQKKGYEFVSFEDLI